MKERIQLPYAELYTIECSQKQKKRILYEYIKTELKKLHPGFSSESLWDYVIIKNEEFKYVKAAVLDKNYFIERRLKNRRISFYIDEDNKEVFLFKSSDFDSRGNRRKNKIIIHISVVLFLFLSLSAYLIVQNIRDEMEETVIVANAEISPVIEQSYNYFDIINFCAKVIYENNGKIESIDFVYKDSGEITFNVLNADPYELIKEISKNQLIRKTTCSNISYNDNKETFEIAVNLSPQSIFVNQINNIELLEIRKNIHKQINKLGLEIISSWINQDYCSVGFRLKNSLDSLSESNKQLETVIIENGLLLSKLKEMSDGDKIYTEIEIIPLSKEQKISDAEYPEYLSKIFEVKSYQANIKKTNTNKNMEAFHKIKSNENFNLVKIGSVMKDGKRLYYYKTENGKLFTTEEDYGKK